MKKILIYSLCLLIGAQSGNAQGILRNLQQQPFSTDSLLGKKTMVMILPLQQDTAIANQLMRFQQQYGDSVCTMGLVCLAPCEAVSDTIAAWYSAALGAGVLVITEMETNDTASQHSSVLHWLVEKNKHNRADEPGLEGSKYFLSKQGRLYAQAGLATSLDHILVRNIIRTRVPGEN